MSGVARDVASVSVAADVDSVMPAQATAVSGITAAMGDVSWADGELSTASSPNPWSADGVPVPGAPVEVDFGFNGVMVRQLTGVIDGSSGSVASGDSSSPIVDGIDRLNQPVSFPALLNQMPGLTDFSVTRNIGLSPTYFTDLILRKCGFYATPNYGTGCVFSAPLMGSAWPEVGAVTASAARSDANSSVAFLDVPWGLATGNADIIYTPALGGFSGFLDQPFQMTMMVGTRSSSSATLAYTARWGTHGVRLTVGPTRSILAQVIVNNAVSTVCSISSANAATAETFTLRVLPSGNFALYASNGATSTATTALPAAMGTTAMDRLTVLVPFGSHPIGGLLANFGTSASYAYTRTAKLTPSAHKYGMPAFPAVVNRRAFDLLREQSDAELAGMWLDAYGVFHWRNRDVLIASTPVATLTARDGIHDIQWEYTAASLRERVEVKYHRHEITRRTTASVPVWFGSGASLNSGETETEFISPSSDEEWIMVDTSPRRVAESEGENFNRGRGSYSGGVITNEGDEIRWATATELSTSVAQVDHRTYKVVEQVGSLATGDILERRIFSSDFGPDFWIWHYWRDEKLPMIRAKAKVKALPETVTGVNRGPSTAAVLEHDVGPWIQDLLAVHELADWLSGQLNVPQPVIPGLDVVPDLRLERGDVVWVEDPDNLRVRVKMLVTGVKLGFDGAEITQSLTGRIITVEKLNPTLTEHDLVWSLPGDTLTTHDTALASYTLAQHDAAPLARS